MKNIFLPKVMMCIIALFTLIYQLLHKKQMRQMSTKKR